MADRPKAPHLLEAPPAVPELSEDADPRQIARAYATMALAYYQQWKAVHDELLSLRDWLQATEHRLKLIEERTNGRGFEHWLVVVAMLVVIIGVIFRLFSK